MKSSRILFVAVLSLVSWRSASAQLPVTIPGLPIQTGTSVGVPDAPIVKAYTGENVITTGTGTTAVFGTFGIPQPNAVEGLEILNNKKIPAIFSETSEQVFRVGTSPGLAAFPSAVVKKVGQPNGDVAFIKITDPHDFVGAKNNTLLVSGLTVGEPVVIARTGTPGTSGTAANGLPVGVGIQRFLAVDGTGTDPFFLAVLSGTAGHPVALCSVTGSSVNVVLTKGQAAFDSNVKGFTTLTGSRGTLADGRWRVDGTDFGALLKLADGRQVAAIIPATVSGTAGFTALLKTGVGTFTGPSDGLEGATISRLGLPGFGPSSVAALCTLKTSGTAITAGNNVVLVTTLNGPTVLARKGGEVNNGSGTPVAGVFYKTLQNPVSGASGSVAYEATIRGNGITPASRLGIWYASTGANSVLVARTGDAAATSGTGTGSGGHYASFVSLGLSAGTGLGPVFTGRLRVSKADGVTAKNNFGLYAVDSTGRIDLLFRTGQSVTIPSSTTAKIVRSFVGLVPAPGSLGAQNTFDDTGKVTVIATFTDKTQALLKITVP